MDAYSSSGAYFKIHLKGGGAYSNGTVIWKRALTRSFVVIVSTLNCTVFNIFDLRYLKWVTLWYRVD